MLQNVVMVIHIFGFIAIIVVLWVLAPHVDTNTALFTFTNEAGWSTTGLTLMIGQITSVAALASADAAAHMSEEVTDAGLTVPNAMAWTFVVNGAMGFVMMVSYIYAIPSIDDALNDPTGYPFIYVFQLAMPPNGTIVMVVLIMVLLMVGNISYQASTARQTFAFARDHGLPFARWIGKVDHRVHVPVNAVLLSAAFTLLLSVIYVGSSSAFNAMLSLQLNALLCTYCISITCVLYRRITAPHLLPKARWSLGKYGIFINTCSIAYSWTTFFWCFWPNSTPVDTSSMNWAVVMFMGTLAIALVYYFTTARHHYKGPVTFTEAYRSHQQLERLD